MRGKTYGMILTVAVSLLLATVTSYPQTNPALSATIPFDFSVGQTTLPAGQYYVKLRGPSPYLMIQTKAGDKSVFVMTIWASSNTAPTVSKLVFNKYGDRYFLANIWRSGETLGHQLLKSRAETEIAKMSSTVQTAAVVLDKP